MPNRIIKESILTSPNLNKLSEAGENHFYRLLLITDDWGCAEVTPAVIKGKCYPLKTQVTITNIETWNRELIDNKILKTWEERDRIYGEYITFDVHNDLSERHNPKTPCPPWLLKVKGFDPRLPDKTLEAFGRINTAITKLSKNGRKPHLREIASEANSSLSTVRKYLKESTKPDVTLVTDDTGNNK